VVLKLGSAKQFSEAGKHISKNQNDTAEEKILKEKNFEKIFEEMHEEKIFLGNLSFQTKLNNYLSKLNNTICYETLQDT